MYGIGCPVKTIGIRDIFTHVSAPTYLFTPVSTTHSSSEANSTLEEYPPPLQLHCTQVSEGGLASTVIQGLLQIKPVEQSSRNLLLYDLYRDLQKYRFEPYALLTKQIGPEVLDFLGRTGVHLLPSHSVPEGTFIMVAEPKQFGTLWQYGEDSYTFAIISDRSLACRRVSAPTLWDRLLETPL